MLHAGRVKRDSLPSAPPVLPFLPLVRPPGAVLRWLCTTGSRAASATRD